MHPLAELRTWLQNSAAKFRARREFPAVVHLEVAAAIAADIAAQAGQIVSTAHAAEIADREAELLLAAALQDNRVTPDELPQLRVALRHIRRSAELDHDLTEQARITA